MPQDLHSLRKAGVRFLPWVGARYENGFIKRRLLILGHSHYEQWLGTKHELGEEITNRCIRKAASGSDDSPLWANIERALLNGVRANDARTEGATMWVHVAFYSFADPQR